MLTAEDYDRYITGLETLYRQVSDYKDLDTLTTVPKKMSEILKGITGENDFHRVVFQAIPEVKESIEANKEQHISHIQSLVQTKLAELIQDTQTFRAACLKSSSPSLYLSAAETELVEMRSHLEEREREINEMTEFLQAAEAALKESENALQQAQEQHQQEKVEYEKRLQQTEEEIKTLWTQLGDLETEKQGLAKEKQTLETTLSQMNEQIGSLRNEVQHLQETTAMFQLKQDQREDAAERRKSLMSKMDSLPEGLREFVQALLEIADHAEKQDAPWLREKGRISALERFVYSSPESIGLLAQRNYADSTTLYQVIALQNWTHECLRAAGIEPIYPAQGEPFDVQFHDFNDRDLVYTNDKPQWNKCVHSVVQIGFFDRRNYRVLRKATIKRYYYTGTETPPVQNDQTDAAGTAPLTTKGTQESNERMGENRFQALPVQEDNASTAGVQNMIRPSPPVVETQADVPSSDSIANQNQSVPVPLKQPEPDRTDSEIKMDEAEVSLETAALKRRT